MFRAWGAVTALLFTVTSITAADKPNIIVILADDLGYADVGYHGCRDIPTPHIDALAKGGTYFTNGYVSGPYCSPTRAGLLTGRYQTRFGHEFNPTSANAGLPRSELTLAQHLKSAGYATGLVGKWHLGSTEQQHPQQRGFDEFFGFLGGAHSYFPQKNNSETILRGHKPAGETEYLTDALAREAVAFVEKYKKQPFFLYLAFNAVHTPMQATEERLKKFASIADEQRRIYAAMTMAMDEAIGQLRAKLKAEKLDEKTLIFFFSDNGGPTMKGTTINASSNAPLRGSKRTTLEGGIRVPFIVHWPGKIPAGRKYDGLVIQLDIVPTALAAAGVPLKPEWKIDGVNWLPYLTGEKTGSPHETLYWRFGSQMAIRQGDWKLVVYDLAAEGGRGMSPPRLYNLAHDIGEETDLFSQQPDKARQLQAAWDEWNKANVAPLWGGGKK
ncbi:MAG: sulfatase [Gemmataceae bacterium]|nr:sulfatase [Gemmata sp.]MDW8196653.1 sulfatase [Gemmataceae bacterium]